MLYRSPTHKLDKLTFTPLCPAQAQWSTNTLLLAVYTVFYTKPRTSPRI